MQCFKVDAEPTDNKKKKKNIAILEYKLRNGSRLVVKGNLFEALKSYQVDPVTKLHVEMSLIGHLWPRPPVASLASQIGSFLVRKSALALMSAN